MYTKVDVRGFYLQVLCYKFRPVTLVSSFPDCRSSQLVLWIRVFSGQRLKRRRALFFQFESFVGCSSFLSPSYKPTSSVLSVGPFVSLATTTSFG